MMVSFSSLIGVVGDRVGARHKAPVGGADLLLEERGVSQDGHCQGEHCTFCLSVSALLTPQFELFLHFVLGGGGSGNKFGVETGMG